MQPPGLDRGQLIRLGQPGGILFVGHPEIGREAPLCVGVVPAIDEIVDLVEARLFWSDEVEKGSVSDIDAPSIDSRFDQVPGSYIQNTEAATSPVEHLDLAVQGVPRVEAPTTMAAPTLCPGDEADELETIENRGLGIVFAKAASENWSRRRHSPVGEGAPTPPPRR